ncbi:major facilitator superfamily domain-containing protein [Thermothelomyces heterothallicus CBS 202.75]|uniref:major facilitator superfamily domain-containing protein n=1 Tax=Thermothelomyces heterothallicus CBS 202.75 TaxID=1149848 RepID=UPI0037428496
MPGWKYAFSLPSEAVKAATPPGTILLTDVVRVVRFPTPTADPADPLNWPRWQKAACMVTLSLYAFVSNYISASIAPALPRWNYEFPDDRRPSQDLMQFVAVNVLVLGLGSIFWVPLSNIFGRRLVLVLSTLLLFSVTCCGIPFTGFTPTLIIRIFQGLGSSASETVVPAVVGDLFFVNERGSWMAFYTASLASGSVVGGITGGYVAAELGWVGQFWIGTGLSGLAFLATVLLVPESMFDRDRQTVPVQRTLPPISRPGRPRIRSTAPKLSLMTLPSMRFTLPSRFRWRPPPDDDDEAALTWYDSSSSVDLASPIMTDNCARLDSSIYGNLIDLSRLQANGSANRNGANNKNNNNANNGDDNGYGGNTGGHAPSEHRPWTYLRSLAMGRYRGRAARRFAQPWSTLRLPATWIIMLQYGGLVGGVAVISTVGPELLLGAPYRWGERRAGLLFVGALVGILLGGACTGLAADRRAASASASASDAAAAAAAAATAGSARARARARAHAHAGGGLVEPEAGVPLLLPALLIGTCGLAIFGVCAQHPSPAGWVGLEFAFGMVAFALAQVPSIWFGYLIDAYDQLASDCFVMICILRGAIPFAWTFFVAQWIQRDGFLIPFGGFTAIMGAFSLLVIPILCGGKRMRIATARYVSENQS